ncbi:MAG: lipid II flippase MurJ, partial [Myxococcales bacterium]
MTADAGGGPAAEPGLATDSQTPAARGSAAGARSMDMGRGARRVSGLTMLSRLLGLVREQIFAVTLGAGAYSDAFLAAFRIPNLLRDLFAEGALSTAFVPTYVRTLKKEGRPAAYALANRVLTTLTLYLGA